MGLFFSRLLLGQGTANDEQTRVGLLVPGTVFKQGVSDVVGESCCLAASLNSLAQTVLGYHDEVSERLESLRTNENR